MIGVWKDGTCEECFLIYWEGGNENHFMSGSMCARMCRREGEEPVRGRGGRGRRRRRREERGRRFRNLDNGLYDYDLGS